jgi:RNA polymerase sigma factor (sigma-70 family)
VPEPETRIEDLLRDLAPQVLGALARRYGHFDLAEDAVQEALLAAASQWLAEGIPASPRGWLITVAGRRLTDLLRAEQARQRREEAAARQVRGDHGPAAGAPPDADDTLVLLLLCCHPALSAASQVALTLRAVGGLTTAEIARVFLVPEATMTRRITRAKQAIADSGAEFTMPETDERAARLAALRQIIYLIFTEGYASTSWPSLLRPDLCAEAIRLARMLHALLPGDAEVTGLLALLLLTDARRPARTGPGGLPVPMAEQDRGEWDAARIAEGTALVTEALRRGPPGPCQVQAAIAALHDEAPTAGETDWPQILALYEVLMQASDNPVVALNHAVAAAMVHGPRVGLDLLENVSADQRIAAAHRLHAVRANLLELAGDRDAARDAYLRAAELTASPPHQRYLNARAARLADQRADGANG